MTISLIVIDGFMEDFEAARQVALSTPFGVQEYQGHSYAGIGLGTLDTKSKVEEILGIPMIEHLSYFRLGQAGTEVTGHIHADVNCGEWATVLYLNLPEQCQGGTAFYKNKRLNSEIIPPPDVITEAGNHYSPEFAAEINSESNDESKWELKSVIAMRPNRMIIYPTALFHSRYPRDAFGHDAETGRLIHVSFLSVKR
jgi:Family of unknown function (DUF6445)